MTTWWLMARLSIAVGSLALVWLGLGCSNEGPAAESTAPLASASGTIAASPSGAPERALPAMPGAGGGVTVSSSLVPGDPKLGRLLTVASPACQIVERFMVMGPDVNASVEAYAPWLPAAELSSRFDAEAAAQGLSVKDQPPLGRGVFADGAFNMALVGPSRVTVMTRAAASWKARAAELSREAQLEMWALLESFGDDVKWDTFAVTRHAAGVSGDWTGRASTDVSAKIASFAKAHGVEQQGNDWIRVGGVGKSSIGLLISPEHLTVVESRGGGPVGALCRAGALPPDAAPASESSADRSTQSNELDAQLEELLK